MPYTVPCDTVSAIHGSRASRASAGCPATTAAQSPDRLPRKRLLEVTSGGPSLSLPQQAQVRSGCLVFWWELKSMQYKLAAAVDAVDFDEKRYIRHRSRVARAVSGTRARSARPRELHHVFLRATRRQRGLSSCRVLLSAERLKR